MKYQTDNKYRKYVQGCGFLQKKELLKTNMVKNELILQKSLARVNMVNY